MSTAASPVDTAERPMRPKALKAMSAAKLVFLESGYDAATMDAIAREAGISKATLYAHFASKEELFEALIRFECRAVNARLHPPDPGNPRIESELEKAAANIRSIFAQKQGLDLYRIIVPVAPRFPRLAMVFYDEGPRTSLQQIADYLQALDAAGLLRIPDPRIASHQFLALVTEDLKLTGALALADPDPERGTALVQSGIGMFLSFYKA